MKVFQVSEYDWYMAETAEQARDAAIEDFSGCDDCVYDLEEVIEVSESELERLKFFDEDDEVTRSFKAELERRIKKGVTKPEAFASPEY